jgi:dUTP pyrophosphatase
MSKTVRSRSTSVGEDDYGVGGGGGSRSVMLLKLYVEDTGLREKYLDAVCSHNEKIDEVGGFYDSGFDLFMPEELEVEGVMTLLDTGVKCAAFWLDSDDWVGAPTGFYMYPRSSLSKTPLRLANSVGIIDSGYRGNLKAAMDCWSDKYTVAKHARLVQICAPNLGKMRVILVDSEHDLGTTERGSGGFGSTGK